MSLFKPRRAVVEQRSTSYTDVWGSGGNWDSQGASSSIAAGLRLIPVYAAVSLITDMLATSPLAMYNTAADGSRQMLAKQPQIITNPQPYGTRIDWLSQCITSLLLRGNAYGYVTAMGSDGWPSQIIWFHPDDVSVVEEQETWFHTPQYFWRGRPLDRRLVVHIAGMTLGRSVVGLSPLSLFKLQIEKGMRAEKFADDWFASGANPSGVLRNTERTVPPDHANDAKKAFKASVANRDVFVTGNDWDYTSLSVTPSESQFLETIRATATQMAAVFRVSPEDIGGDTGTGSSMTYKTLTQDSTKLNVRTLNPWAQRIATALSDRRPRPQWAAFDLDALARGDRAQRISAAGQALTLGIDTIDEARAAENKPPLTPDQIETWQMFYGKKSGPTPAPLVSEPDKADHTDITPADPAGPADATAHETDPKAAPA